MMNITITGAPRAGALFIQNSTHYVDYTDFEKRDSDSAKNFVLDCLSDFIDDLDKVKKN